MAAKKDKGAGKSGKSGKSAKPAKGGKSAKPAKGGKSAKPAKGGKASGGAKVSKQGAKGGKKGKGGKKKAIPAQARSPIPVRLKEKYRTEIAPRLMQELGLKNVMEVPKLRKITLNMGVGEAVGNNKLIGFAVEELEAIAGQRPVVTNARKSIAIYKLRAGMPIGCMVTLRGDRMYEFLDRLLSIALPRVRDFRGVGSKGFDGRGNYTLGIREQIIFPEIDYDKLDKIRGLNVSITTSAANDEQGRALLSELGMPFAQ